MAWSMPKTDWTPTDYFNIEDWERVRDNLVFLQRKLASLGFGTFALQSLDTPKGIDALPSVELINRLEAGLTSAYQLVSGAIPEWQAPVVWYARLNSQYTQNPTYADWTRWERSTQQIRQWAPKSVAAQPRSGEFYAGEI